MYFGLSQDQILLQDSVGKFIEKQAPLEAVRRFVDAETSVAEGVEAGLVELGLPLMMLDEADGGLAMGLLEATLVQQCLGRHAAPTAFTGRTVLAPMALAALPAGDRRNQLISSYSAGADRYAVALTEHTGAREGGGLRYGDGQVSGRVSFVFDWPNASHLLVPVAGQLLRIEAAAATVTELTTIDRTRPTVTLDFDAAEAECLAEGYEDETQSLIDAARVLLAADSFGAAEMMLEKAVAYAKERQQFGRVIGSFQAVKHMCAEMTAALEPCRSLIWYAAYAHDAVPEEAPLMSRLAKARMSEVGRDVARSATEVHGGMGFTDLLGLHYWFKRIGMNRQWLGGPVQLRAEAARLQGWA